MPLRRMKKKMYNFFLFLDISFSIETARIYTKHIAVFALG